MLNKLTIIIFIILAHTTTYAMARFSGYSKRIKTPSVSLDKRKCTSPCKISLKMRNRDKKLRGKDYKFRIDFGDGSPILLTNKKNIEHTYIAHKNKRRRYWRRFFRRYKIFRPKVSVVFNERKSRSHSRFLFVKRANEVLNDPPVVAPECQEITPLTVSCSANATDSTGTITSINWNFGDGTSAQGETVTHSYTAGGTYNVSVVAIDNLEAEGSAELSTTVIDALIPTAAYFNFNGDPEQIHFKEGDTIILDSSISSAQDGTIASRKWFVNGDEISSEEQLELDSNGVQDYQVRLVVKDTFGREGEVSFTVTVSPSIIPTINVIKNNSYAPVNLTFSLENTEDLIAPLSYSWEVYDQNSSEATWSSTLSKVGKYLVSLKLTDGKGYIYTVDQEIDVISDGAYINGPDSLDIVEGNTTREFLEVFGIDGNENVLTTSPINSAITINSTGRLDVDGSNLELLPESIGITTTSGSTSFTKTITLNKIVPQLVAELPVGFSGSYIINNSSSDLHNFEVIVDPEDAKGSNQIRIFTTNKRIIVKSDIDLIKGIRLKASGENSFEVNDRSEKTYVSGILSARGPLRGINEVRICNKSILSSNILSLRDDFYNSRQVYTGHEFALSNKVIVGESLPNKISQNKRESHYNQLLDTIGDMIDGKGLTIYLLDSDSNDGEFVKGTHAFVPTYIKNTIYFNLEEDFAGKKDLRNRAWRGVTHHEGRHVEQDNILGCYNTSMSETNPSLAKYILENDAEASTFKFLNSESNTVYKDYLTTIGALKDYWEGNYYKYGASTEDGLVYLSSSPNSDPYALPHLWNGEDGLAYFTRIANGTLDVPENMVDFLSSFSVDKGQNIEDIFYSQLFPRQVGGFPLRMAESMGYNSSDQSFINSRLVSDKRQIYLPAIAPSFFAIDINEARINGNVGVDNKLKLNIKSDNINDIHLSYQLSTSGALKNRVRGSIIPDDNGDYIFEVDLSQAPEFVYFYLVNSGLSSKNLELSLISAVEKVEVTFCNATVGNQSVLNFNIEGSSFTLNHTPYVNDFGQIRAVCECKILELEDREYSIDIDGSSSDPNFGIEDSIESYNGTINTSSARGAYHVTYIIEHPIVRWVIKEGGSLCNDVMYK
jgi:hypothetical protein